jgi:hypothetical protein
MLDSRARERAFGPPDRPGDPVLIEHIATRFVEVYEEMLDIAARLRGVGVSDNMISVMDATAHLVDNSLREIRDFIDQVITETDTIPDRMARDEPIAITLTLTLTMDAEAERHFYREMKRARRKIKR